jgi:hypothetical protein
MFTSTQKVVKADCHTLGENRRGGLGNESVGRISGKAADSRSVSAALQRNPPDEIFGASR